MSAQDYLIETRLNQARKMLTTTTIPVSEIAWRVGYQNELNLFRAFKNKYGMPPNTYRKQNKKNCPKKQFFFFAFCL